MLDDGNKRALSFCENRDVTVFVVGLSGLPASVDDADPFVGEAAQDGVVAVTLLFLLEVVSLGPARLHDRLGSPFDKGLAPEFAAGVTTVDEVRLAALFGDGGDAAMTLHARGVRVDGAVGPEEGGDAGAEIGPGSRQGAENVGILVSEESVGDELIESRDAGLQSADLFDESESELGIGVDDDLVGADRHRIGDDFEAFLDGLGTTRTVGEIELFDGVGASLAQGLEGGPLFEEGERQRSEQVAAGQLESLREAVFEDLGEAVGGADAQIDKLTALLGEDGEFAGAGIVGLPRGQKVVLLEDEPGEMEGVLFVVLGAGGVEGFAVALEGDRIDQVQAQEVELAEEVQEAGARLLDAECGARAGREHGLNLASPGHHDFGSGGDRRLFEDLAVQVEEAEVEPGVGAIDADEEVRFHMMELVSFC